MKTLILTDKSTSIGMGHYTRMSAMANALLTLNCEVEIFINGDAQNLKSNEKYLDWKQLEVSSFNHYDLILIDSYLYDQQFLDKLVVACKNVLVIDDLERLYYRNCIVLNPNLMGETQKYLNCENVKLLTGPEYCLLRDEFLQETNYKINEFVSKVFVTFGGTDPFSNSLEVLEKIQENSSIQYVFALGSGTTEELKGKLLEAAGDKDCITVKIGLTASEMKEELEAADIIISASGQTVSEVIRLMKPAFFVKVIENQQLNYNFLKNTGTGIPVNSVSEIEINELSSLENRMKLINQMESYSSKMRGTVTILAEIIQMISQE